MRLNELKDFLAARCDSGQIGRILNYDQSGRTFAVFSFGRQVGVQQVSVLSGLHVGESGVLETLNLPESVQNHLMHMGFVPGALITVLRRAPAGDPTVYGVDGMEIALRHETADSIRVHPASEAEKIGPQAEEYPALIEAAQ
jgi:ferrous iron transport protein A